LKPALALCGGDKRIRTNMFNALRRWQLESWPGMI
jgi:tRNA 2-thiocytidine biosynthesis protein TtcA